MRKFIVLEFMSLDGVMQAPGGPDEDTSGGFEYGGWVAPFEDESAGETMQELMQPADLLLGRHTFEIFANYWPDHAEIWPGIMDVQKYVLSSTLRDDDPLVTRWSHSHVLRSLDDIIRLKQTDGLAIKIWGSSQLLRLLLQHDLVDEICLMIHPIILGKGKNLFGPETKPTNFELVSSFTTRKGVIMTRYRHAGQVQTGRISD